MSILHNDRDPLPKRLGPGKRNLDLFLVGSKTTPICFYFEDEGSEELYTRFLARLFPGYLTPLVICTGGKTKKEVLSDADTHKIAPIVFVQDKDFDDIIGTLSTDHRVVTLNRYSFENYLLEPDALLEIAIESKRRLRRQAAAEALAFPKYLPELYASYRPLATLFVVAQRMNLKGVKTTKQSISDLCGAAVTTVSQESVTKFKKVVTRAALAAQRINTEDDIDALLIHALNPKPEYLGHADLNMNSQYCGKHLLDLVLAYIDSKVETKLSKSDRFEIAMRLVLHLPIEVFERVKSAILEALKQQGASVEVIASLS